MTTVGISVFSQQLVSVRSLHRPVGRRTVPL